MVIVKSWGYIFKKKSYFLPFWQVWTSKDKSKQVWTCPPNILPSLHSSTFSCQRRSCSWHILVRIHSITVMVCQNFLQVQKQITHLLDNTLGQYIIYLLFSTQCRKTWAKIPIVYFIHGRSQARHKQRCCTLNGTFPLRKCSEKDIDMLTQKRRFELVFLLI